MKSCPIALFLSILTSCGDGAVLSVTVPLTGDHCRVDKARVTVTAPGMAPVGPSNLNITDFAFIAGNIKDIPLGFDRKVMVEALNERERVVYSGSGIVDVLAEEPPTILGITIYRNWTNCPNEDDEDDDED